MPVVFLHHTVTNAELGKERLIILLVEIVFTGLACCTSRRVNFGTAFGHSKVNLLI